MAGAGRGRRETFQRGSRLNVRMEGPERQRERRRGDGKRSLRECVSEYLVSEQFVS